jgi:3-deoxy-D-manno-octulosonic-acid transferase
MGDARFDQVWKRARGVDRGSPLLRPFGGSPVPTLVAGSTWPEDEARLLPAVRSCRDAGYPLRLILAPHEPTPEHLHASESALDELGLTHLPLAALLDGASVPEVVLVDRVGVLGDLYAVADLAYVGGGWGTGGLHSVLEPAAFGAPVLFGPRHANAREAAELIEAGGAFSSPDQDALAGWNCDLAADSHKRRGSGLAARAYVEAGLGAAERGAHIIEGLLEHAGTREPGP